MAKQTILIIEDDRFFRSIIAQKLEKEGYEVLAVSDSKETFKMLEQKIPSLVILDLILPGMDGFEVLSAIKGDEKTKNIPVIVASNLGQKEDVDRALALGAVDFMIKVNFTPEEITAKVKKVLQSH